MGKIYGDLFGDYEPCNGFTLRPDKIYAVYNKDVKCVGFHEDAHLISYTINRPNSSAIREGLAMYFDKYWWGIQNLDWTVYFIKSNLYISIAELLDNEKFFSLNCALTYPIMGAFTEWLISSYGINKYLSFYKKTDSISAVTEIYEKSIEELNEQFKEYVSLFSIDETVESQIIIYS